MKCAPAQVLNGAIAAALFNLIYTFLLSQRVKWYAMCPWLDLVNHRGTVEARPRGGMVRVWGGLLRAWSWLSQVWGWRCCAPSPAVPPRNVWGRHGQGLGLASRYGAGAAVFYVLLRPPAK